MNFLFSLKSDKNKRRILPSEEEGAPRNPTEGRPVSPGSPQTQEKPSQEGGTGFDYRTAPRYSSRSEGHKVIVPHTTEVQYWKNRNQTTLPQYTVPVGEHYTQPKLPLKSFKSYGGVVVDELGNVLIREPANHFDGYAWTWPKGVANPEELPQEAALREVLEETGYRCEIVGSKPIGEFYNSAGNKSVFYLMKPVEQVAAPDKETARIAWVSYDEAKRLISQTTNHLGRLRDLTVLEYARRGKS